eukprot:TRINITY_DN38781_c0_g1_i1.p1 TRINITY_DN38781_c0_g1~~TRINITY_DN38781_c0_g1_i1.p1  ORF type:complete len:134 (+),score=18.30 TRINITY_DN38781_c0_g1_i1:132-533(+)
MEEFMELKWSGHAEMNPLQAQSKSASYASADAPQDPARPLKKYLVERTLQGITATHLLAKSISKASKSEDVAKFSAELNTKASDIKALGQTLEKMPGVLAALDAHMDLALERAQRLSSTSTVLSEVSTGAALS